MVYEAMGFLGGSPNSSSQTQALVLTDAAPLAAPPCDQAMLRSTGLAPPQTEAPPVQGREAGDRVPVLRGRQSNVLEMLADVRRPRKEHRACSRLRFQP